jgi:hypothetical protein
VALLEKRDYINDRAFHNRENPVGKLRSIMGGCYSHGAGVEEVVVSDYS